MSPFTGRVRSCRIDDGERPGLGAAGVDHEAVADGEHRRAIGVVELDALVRLEEPAHGAAIAVGLVDVVVGRRRDRAAEPGGPRGSRCRRGGAGPACAGTAWRQRQTCRTVPCPSRRSSRARTAGASAAPPRRHFPPAAASTMVPVSVRTCHPPFTAESDSTYSSSRRTKRRVGRTARRPGRCRR